ncbi:hypothetical protein [Desulfotalea psychrophila]|uniref:Uncharacterized protein n=1 Tax=Desulfotalea psychrophila (strain LSv54 / DSM 12343) TaxID=177439 RepID=Q6ALK2_DESPS|nr:hypothetical protein [Desulfotalea psychrophila]CAG36773.1 unknown protein [Desulfotalea psychrophila LSv54]
MADRCLGVGSVFLFAVVQEDVDVELLAGGTTLNETFGFDCAACLAIAYLNFSSIDVEGVGPLGEGRVAPPSKSTILTAKTICTAVVRTWQPPFFFMFLCPWMGGMLRWQGCQGAAFSRVPLCGI